MNFVATRGAKPKSPFLKLVTGNPGRRPIRVPSGIEHRTGPLRPPRKLTRPQAALWKRFIDRATWLNDFDAPTAYAWVVIQSEFQADPEAVQAARLGQLRLLAGELGLNFSSRQRLGIGHGEKEEDPNQKYFD